MDSQNGKMFGLTEESNGKKTIDVECRKDVSYEKREKGESN